MNLNRLFDSIIAHEGEVKRNKRHLPYDDKTGKPLKPGDTLQGKITIGSGRNLSDKGISEVERNIMLRVDVKEATDTMPNREIWKRLNDVRQEVCVEMNFNLGPGKYRRFLKHWRALDAGLFGEAAKQMENSKWYRQVGGRGPKLAGRMRTGIF